MGKSMQEMIEETKKQYKSKKKNGKKTSQTSQAEEREEREKRRVKLIYNSMLKQFKIPKRFADKGFSNYEVTEDNKEYHERVMSYATSFEEHYNNGDWLVLSGSFGLGKTHLALAVARHVLKFFAKKNSKTNHGTIYTGLPKVLFLSSSELIQNIRDSYDSDELDERSLMNKYKNTELLIIDDLGTEKATEWQQEKMYMGLDYRYREMKPTIITTNLSAGELSEHITERVYERIIETTRQGELLIFFEGDSYRKEIKE